MINKKKQKLFELQNSIHINNNKICDFNSDIIHTNLNTNSCFDFQFAKLDKYSDIKPNINTLSSEIPKYKSKIINLIINNKQHLIFQNWFNCYIKMYNQTIKYFIKIKINELIKNYKQIFNKINKLNINKKEIENKDTELKKDKKKLVIELNKLIKKKEKTENKKAINKLKINEKIEQIQKMKINIKRNNINLHKINIELNKLNNEKNNKLKTITTNLDYQKIRTNKLKKIRDDIIMKSTKVKKERIKAHIMDTAIKMACISYKSCFANYINGNIKRFRIKYWSNNKNKKIMEIEKEYIRNGSLFKDILGDLNLKYNRQKYKLSDSNTIKILYDKKLNKYKLLVLEKIEIKESKSEKYITIDQGIKPFIACRTNDKLIKIGTKTAKMVGDYIERIDKINNNKNINKEQKRRKEIKYYEKIENKVDEIHWKTINYIIKNYGIVVIGNVSIKNASKKETSELSPKIKRIGLMMRLSEFRMRLEYKCLINKIKIETVDESYTSKVCSKCGNYKENLKGEKIYECEKCNKKRDRDYNSATNMLIMRL